MTTEAQKSMRALNGFLGRCIPHRREWAEEAQTRSDEFQELIGREPDILDDLAQQIRRDVTADVEWHSRDAAIRVAELLMRSTLANFHESELPEDADNFSRLRTGSFGTSTYLDELRSDELSLDLRLTIFKEQSQDLAEVRI